MTYLQDEYLSNNLIYQKYNNEGCNTRDKVTYLASMFIKKNSKNGVVFPQVLGSVKDDQLVFDAEYESGNLMMVYKVNVVGYL